MFIRTCIVAMAALLLQTGFLSAQTPLWTSYIDSVSFYSSPRLTDLNQDNILDVVIGGGIESQPSRSGVTALDGIDGSLLWKLPARDQVFGTALFRDITGDQVDEVFIGGRDGQFWAINGATGAPEWEFWPDSLGPASAFGWYHFFNPQWVDDQDQDGIPDLLISNGGDRNALAYDSLRPPGSLMLISAANGQVIARDTMPDGHETYFSPLLLDVDGTGDPFIIFGSGGETVRGRLWADRLSHLRNNDLSAAIILLDDSSKGMIASPSLADLNADAIPDLVVPELNGRLTALNGDGFTRLWSLDFPGYEMYTAPAIGQFTGDPTPDVFCIAARGQWSFYSDYLIFAVDGATGQIAWSDSSFYYQFSQVNAADRDGDGFYEVLFLENRDIGFSTVEYRNQFRWIDINDNQVQDFGLLRNGLAVFTTPMLTDLDGDSFVELVYGHHPQTGTWTGNTDAVIERVDLNLPLASVAWPGYMGRDRDGYYRPAIGVGQGESQVELTLRVFPNPADDVIRVSGVVVKALRLWDAQGRLVKENHRSQNLPVRELPAGIYLLEVETPKVLERIRVVVR